MDISVKKIIIALIAGIIVMVAIDYAFAQITNSLYALPFSVLLGAIVAGAIAIKQSWLVGILVGAVNSAITLVIYMNHGPSVINLFIALVYPTISFLFAGLVGGIIGGVIGTRYVANNKVNA